MQERLQFIVEEDVEEWTVHIVHLPGSRVRARTRDAAVGGAVRGIAEMLAQEEDATVLVSCASRVVEAPRR